MIDEPTDRSSGAPRGDAHPDAERAGRLTSTRGTLSRRTFARRVAAASISAMLASGCRDVGGRGVSLHYWNGFAGPDGKTMQALVRRFNAAHDDVQVTMQRMDWAPYYNKLFVAGMAGRAPEVFASHSDQLERFQRAAFLHPVDELFAGPDAMDAGDFDENVLNRARRDGKTIGLPLDVHPAGLFYNRKLFAEAGVPRPPETRDEFLDACHKLRRSDANQWGFVFDWLMVNCYTLLRQWGADFTAEDGTTVTIDSPAAQEAMAFGASLIHELKVAPRIENMNSFIGFRQGRIGMLHAGIFMRQEVARQTDLEWAAAVTPTVGPVQATWANSHNLCIRTGLDERRHAASLKFIRYLSDESLYWVEAGQVPVRKSLRASERFKVLPVQSTFARQIPYLAYMPSTPFTLEMQSEFDIASERILRGSAAPAAALGDAGRNIRAAAARWAAGGGAA